MDAFFTKIDVLMVRAIACRWAMLREYITAVWANPCSTRLAIAIASVASPARTSGSTGISISSCTNGCFSSTSATSRRSSSPAVTPIWRAITAAFLPMKSLFGCTPLCPCTSTTFSSTRSCRSFMTRQWVCASRSSS